jgi:hypothetical protein
MTDDFYESSAGWALLTVLNLAMALLYVAREQESYAIVAGLMCMYVARQWAKSRQGRERL